MDIDLEDLESLLSEHFGFTPTSTPAVSQEDGASSDGSDTDEEVVSLDGLQDGQVHERVQAFVDNQPTEEQSSDGSSDEFELVEEADGSVTVDSIKAFMRKGCSCKRSCHTLFTLDEFHDHVLNVRAMDKDEREMYMMGVLSKEQCDTTKRGKKRKRNRPRYSVAGKTVCKTTFLVAFSIGRSALTNILKHIDKHGVTPRTHGNKGRKPSHAVTFEDVKRVVKFLQNYADNFGLPQPAAPRGLDNIAPIFLPCSTTIEQLRKDYTASCVRRNERAIKMTVFREIWKSCLGHIKIASPREDVCAVCEKLRAKVSDSRTEEEKLQSANALREHVDLGIKERELYNNLIKRAKDTKHLSAETRYNHYTFDFSQNVCIPHHARQMGPVYFTTLRKVQLFGFRVDRMPIQLNFLIDENETMGQDGTQAHGPNAVISMIDWAMEQHCRGETACGIHADNCPGQNKNQYVLGYFMWRVMTGQHQTIEYHMQIPGHARCHVDQGFATIKIKYRNATCHTMDQLEDVVNTSACTNTAVRYPAWQWRDWKQFLTPIFKPITGIRKYQYFRMSADEPGIVTVRTAVDTEEKKYRILKNPAYRFHGVHRPNVVHPAGLSLARQTYLYRTVRPFVGETWQDVTCPAPEDN